MIRRAALGSMLAAGTLALAPASAMGGSYTVNACSPTTAPGSWTQVDTFAAGMTSGNQCGGPLIGPVGAGDAGALFGEDLIGSTQNVPSGANAGWDFVAPAGTVITGVSYYRALNTIAGAGDWVAGLFAGGGARLDTCTTDPSPCSSPNAQVPVTLASLNTSSLFFGIECIPVGGDTSCLAGGTEHDVQAQMYSAAVTLSEASGPVVSAVGGPLWGGGVVWGVVPVTFSASDVSGISQAAVEGATGQLALSPQACQFTLAQPCPQLPSGSVMANTAQLHDGPQIVTLLVSNAAQNTTSVQSPTVVVDNNGPPAPSSFVVAPVAGSTSMVRMTWSNPGSPPEPISGGVAQLCAASCSATVAVSDSGSATLGVPGPGSYGVRLWLTDTAGRGSAVDAATANVSVPPVTPTGPAGPAGPGGTTGPGGSHLRPGAVRLSHRLKGRNLTVTVRLPAGAGTRVTIALSAYRGKKRFLTRTLRLVARRSVATLHLKLSTREVHASRLVLAATVARASSATLTLRHL